MTEGSPVTRVLVVEDEVVVLILAESVIKELGHSTYSAAGVTEALKLFNDPGEIDALFTDIRLPEGNLGGFELAQKLREQQPSLKVLYTTGEALTDGMKAMFVEDARFLAKPYTAEELKAAISDLLAGRG
jgi:CheY-like chemotaxis protein